MIRRPPRSTPLYSSAASDVYKRQDWNPTDEQRAKLEQKHEGKDLDTELEKFKDWHIKKGSKYKNWYRAFDNWLKKTYPSKPKQELFVVDDPDPYGRENAPF